MWHIYDILPLKSHHQLKMGGDRKWGLCFPALFLLLYINNKGSSVVVQASSSSLDSD
jgi:hypothetical protein